MERSVRAGTARAVDVRVHPAATATPPPAHPPLVAQLPWVGLAWASVVLALLVAADQVSRLAANVLDAQGNAWSLAELMGPAAWVSRAGWVADFGGDPLRRSCLTVYVLLDLVLVGLYVAAARWWVRRRFTGPGRRLVLGAVLVVAALDVVEDVLALVAGHADAVPTGLADWLARVSTAKWALGALTAAVLVWGWLTRRPGAVRRTGRAYETLRQHRLSLIPVVVLGLLFVAPGADILDQVPDVVRRWGDGPRPFFVEGGLGVVSVLVLASALLLLGRARTALACRRLDDGSAPQPAGDRGRPGLWLVAPGALLVVAVVLRLAGADVQWDRLVRFCAVPVLVWALSLALRRLARRWHDRHGTPLWRERSETTWSLEELQRLLVVGDAVALGLVVLGAVGAVRAMTPVVVLQVFGLLPPGPYAVAVLVLGSVVVLLWWPLAGRRLARLQVPAAEARPTVRGRVVRWLTPTPGVREPAMLTRLPAVVLGSSVATFVGLGVLPGVASQGGVIFVFVLCVTALTGITAGASLVAGRYPAAEVFRALRLRSTPVVTLLLAAAVFAGEVDAGTPIHAVRSAGAGTPAGRASAERPDLATTVRTWADGQLARGCARPVQVDGRQVGVLPMVLLASEGGGIRAAYWTVQATRPLAGDACAAHATVLSSGVSGGAVGLAVARHDAHPTALVATMSNSRALADGLIGLLVRDFAYAATGIPLPLLDRRDATGWEDRAGLIEDVWNDSAAGGSGWRDQVFAEPGAAPRQPEVGSVVLNSMSVGNACRVWVSEVTLRPSTDDVGARGDGKIDCDASGVSGLRSVDLLSAYGVPAGAPEGVGSTSSSRPGCLDGLRVATAAMLAARFPYVTPSGRVGPCVLPGRTAPPDQLVDGGYLENTGLGTLADLSDVWLPAVQRWNADHAGSADGAGRVVVAPVVVYLDNDTGNDQRSPQRDITSEALLPPLAKLRAGSGGVADDATLQRAVDAVAPSRVCGPTDLACQQALASVAHPLFRVFPGTRPQIAAPLGWILSAASRRAMDDGVAEQLATSCPPGETYVPRRPACQDGSGTLGDLMGLVSRP